MATEIAKAVVDLDGKEAGKQLDALKVKAKDLRDALKEAEKAGDFKSAKKLRKEISENTKEQREYKKAIHEVNVEMDKLNGMSFNKLKKAYRDLKKARDNAKPNTAEWKKYDSQMGQVKKRMDQVSGSMGKTSKMLSSFKSLLPALGIGAAIGMLAKFGKELFNLAIQLEGDSRRASIVFGDSLKYVEEQAEGLSKQMGLTNKQFVAAAANTADLLIPLDFTREAAAEMSVELQSMAGALDEWTGGRLGAAEVSNILTKAMLGENEQLKQLGIAIRKDSEEFRDLVELKLQDEGVTKAQAEAMATLELIQKKSADAQRAYTMEGNKLLRLQKDIVRGWNQMKENIVSYFDEKGSDKIIREKNELNNLVGAITNANNTQESRNRLIAELQTKYPDYLTNLNAETVSNEQLKTRLKEVNEQYDLKIKNMIAEELYSEASKELTKNYKEELEYLKLIAWYENEIAEGRRFTEGDVYTQEDRAEQLEAAKAALEKLREEREKINERIKETIDLLGIKSEVQGTTTSNAVVQLENYRHELENITQMMRLEGTSLKDLILSDEDRDALLENTDILKMSIEELQALFDHPEEDIGGAISEFLFGKDWEDMELSERIIAVGDLTIKTLNDINKIITNFRSFSNSFNSQLIIIHFYVQIICIYTRNFCCY